MHASHRFRRSDRKRESESCCVCEDAWKGARFWQQARAQKLSVQEAKEKLLAQWEEKTMFHRWHRNPKTIALMAVTAASIAALSTPIVRRKIFRSVGWFFSRIF
jgi:hypothetical protein